MISDEQALLSAMHASPCDDAPRLVPIWVVLKEYANAHDPQR